mmetsp:Transcript_45167/g.88362  ORF Transcript_45167/g.88362 Transcript_45167/m.88362 type:complete len:229 (+) Transcript_45167:307-993(+)
MRARHGRRGGGGLRRQGQGRGQRALTRAPPRPAPLGHTRPRRAPFRPAPAWRTVCGGAPLRHAGGGHDGAGLLPRILGRGRARPRPPSQPRDELFLVVGAAGPRPGARSAGVRTGANTVGGPPLVVAGVGPGADTVGGPPVVVGAAGAGGGAAGRGRLLRRDSGPLGAAALRQRRTGGKAVHGDVACGRAQGGRDGGPRCREEGGSVPGGVFLRGCVPIPRPPLPFSL